MADFGDLMSSLFQSSQRGDYGNFFSALDAYNPPMPKLPDFQLPKRTTPRTGPRASHAQVTKIISHLTGGGGRGPAPGTPAAVIAANAKKFGLDPAAVLAYALEESGGRWGAVGDRGYSFGPFQAHGRSPWGAGAAGNRSPQEAKAWATSPQGLVDMMRMMANSGARGLKGEAAVRAIYRGFGRGTPTAIPKGIAQYQNAVKVLSAQGQQMVRGKGLVLPTKFKATHDTDGIPGYQPSIDIMSTPGTQVDAPESGRIIRYGHAQGGHALYFQGDSGRLYWIGHIENAGPLKRYRYGQRIAVVSAHHARPHVHVGILSG